MRQHKLGQFSRGLLNGLVLNIGEFLLNDVVTGKSDETFMTPIPLRNQWQFYRSGIVLTFGMVIVVVLGTRAHDRDSAQE